MGRYIEVSRYIVGIDIIGIVSYRQFRYQFFFDIEIVAVTITKLSVIRPPDVVVGGLEFYRDSFFW